MRCALMLALTAIVSLALLAQPEDLALLIVEPASTQLNLTANEIGSLLILVSNPGGVAAENTRLTLVATGCVELLDERGAWRSNLTLLLGNVTAGTAKRVLVPLRCRDGSGVILITAFADNADPSLASVKVSAKRSEQTEPWVWAAGALAVAVSAIYAARQLSKRRRGGARRGSEFSPSSTRRSARKRTG